MKKWTSFRNFGFLTTLGALSLIAAPSDSNPDEDEFLFYPLYDENDNIQGEFQESNLEQELQKGEKLVQPQEKSAWARKPDPVNVRIPDEQELYPLNERLFKEKTPPSLKKVSTKSQQIPSTPKTLLSPKKTPATAKSDDEFPFDEELFNRQSRDRVFNDFTLNDETDEEPAKTEPQPTQQQATQPQPTTPKATQESTPPPPPEPLKLEPEEKDEVIEEAPKEKEKTTPEVAEETYLIKFNNIKMTEYLNSVSKITGKNFTFDPADLDFNVSIVSNEPMTLKNIIAALLQELRIRGLTMIEIGNTILIHKQGAVSAPAQVYTEKDPLPAGADIVTRVYKLLNANPETLANIIRPMLSANAVIEPLSDSSQLIVTGLRTNIERITTLIESIDSPDASLEMGEYQAVNMPISQAILIAEEVLEPIAKNRPIVLTPYAARNVVYIVSTPHLLQQAIKIFQKIDRGEELEPVGFDADGKPIYNLQELQLDPTLTPEEREQKIREERLKAKGTFQPQQPLGSVEATKFYIHKLQYRQGDQISQALRDIGRTLQDANLIEENYDLVYTIESSQWIESSNSLIFTGTPKTLDLVKELIDELDTALPQVLVEILVLEATVEDSLRFDVDWSTRFGGPNTAGAQSFASAGSTLNAGMYSALPGRSLDSTQFTVPSGFNLGIIGRSVSKDNTIFDTMGALVRALHVDQRVDVLLNPKIVVEDNATAEFFVGLNVPFQTESIANEFGNIVTSNFEFRDVGSTIKITPLIGNNGIVTLTIEQEISSIVANNLITPGGNVITSNLGGGGAVSAAVALDSTVTASGTDQSVQNIGPTTRKSTTKTRVHMPDGYFLIISGQIRDEKRDSRSQVPCLGGIPWIGALFQDRETIIDKKNLMMFIRPQIVDIERINPITKREQDIWRERHRMPKFWDYEVDKTLEWFNVRHPFCDPEEKPLIFQ